MNPTPGIIAFQGEHGAFSESAIWTLHPGAETLPRRSFEDVVRAVENGEVDAGLLPVENTLAGGVAAAYDALTESGVRVTGETVLPIRHCVMGLPGASLDSLREARSHPVALAQCNAFFRERPEIRPVVVHDTAGAAMEVAAQEDPTIAAIAARGAARRYGLELLAEGVQDRTDNQTRFFLIARSDEVPAPPTKARVPAYPLDDPAHPPLKTALLAETANSPGALHALLGVFARRGLDLAYVASRPGGTPWTYRFVLEFRHATPKEAEGALEEAVDVSRVLRVLGTFGRARSVGQGEGALDPVQATG